MFNLNEENEYGLWNCTDFAIQIFNFIYNGLESLRYLGPKMREIWQVKIK